MTKYKIIRERCSCCLELEGSMDNAIDVLVGLKEELESQGWFDLKLEQGYDSYERQYSRYFEVFGDRQETDKERNKRLANAKKVREKKKQNNLLKEEADYLLYEKLKARFEGNSE